MNLQFFDSYPYRTLEPNLQALMLAARRLDAAVAFLMRVQYSAGEIYFNWLRRCKP